MAKLAAPLQLNANEKEARSTTKSTMPSVLKKAIESMSANLLRAELQFLCSVFPAVIPVLELRLLVPQKEVVSYHADTESEDDADSKDESEESASESGNEDNSDSGEDQETKGGPLAERDERMTSRIAICENCKGEFDVTSNKRGDCVWHPGIKDVDYDGDFWADHDPDCHGPYDAFEDDDDFAAGFIWDCCDKPGDGEGCKSTKHKAAVNIVPQSKKRKAEGDASRTGAKKGRH